MSENIASVLDRSVALFPEREAVVDGELRWNYEELGRRVGGLDASLGELGLEPGDVVAVLALNSAAHFVLWLGVPRSGRIFNSLNYRLAPAELEFILSDSGARALFVEDSFLDLGRTLTEACGIEHLIHMGPGETPDGFLPMTEMMEAEPVAPAAPGPEDVAGIFYTGGTTGLPKGAVLTHRNLVSNAEHVLIALRYDKDDVYVHAAPMFHLADGLSTLALTWIGARHVIIRSFSPEGWLEAVECERVTRTMLVPTMINMIANHPEVARRDCSSLATIVYGASPMPSEVLHRSMEVLSCDWIQLYGMTEASPVLSCLDAEDHRRGDAGEEPQAARLRSAGRPIVGVEMGVRREDGSVAEVGEPGEVWARGPNIMRGYWNRPEETAAALDEEGWYHTGDAAYLDDHGYFYIVDRVKDMIISGGENVYSTEVENAIYRHPAVLECAVFGVPDERWGERVHATVVLRPGAVAEEAEIVEHCRQFIAGYKLPRSVDFRGESLPKSGAGKILKRDLREPYWEGREKAVS